MSETRDFLSTMEFNYSDTSLTEPLELPRDRMYYWRVTSDDSHGGIRVSDNVGSFYLRFNGVNETVLHSVLPSVAVYPNPFNDAPAVVWSQLDGAKDAHLTLRDVSGRALGEWSTQVTKGTALWPASELEGLSLAPGIYAFELKSGSQHRTILGIHIP